MSPKELLVETSNLTKAFSGVVALNNVSIRFFASEVHALIGENGAGKSTLVKIISGSYPPSNGNVKIAGNTVEHFTPKAMQSSGISFIHQELNLVPELSVSENIFLGREKTGLLGKIDWKWMHLETRKLTELLGIELEPTARVGSLSIAQQKIVEIAKALSMDAKVIIMDEPTDVLTSSETEKLFKIILQLKSQGKGIIYISHRLEELKEICDVFTVLRDGQFVGHGQVSEYDKQQMIDMMVGRKLEDQYPRVETQRGAVGIRVNNLNKPDILRNINFEAYKGEILGLSGLVGSGRSELMKCVFGDDINFTGEIIIDDEKAHISSPKKAIQKGLYLINEDRKKEGIIPEMSTKDNITLSIIRNLQTRVYSLNHSKEQSVAKSSIESLSIKTPSPNQPIKMLSGGNQQKTLLARGILTEPKVLILDEPTRGIDVGAKVSIYQIINRLKTQGVAIIVISSELPEILGICDRILVMHNGEITGEFMRDEANEQKLLACAFGERRSLS